MNAVITLNFEGSQIRSVMIDGEPGFVGKDVCERLGYTNPNKAMKDHCRGVTNRYPIVDSLGRTQQARILFMPDVLRLITGSALPDAERMERWMFEEVLPTVIKTGSYTSDGMVTNFGPAARSTLGGIVKRVTHAEIEEMFGQVLPALVEPLLERMVSERLMSGRAKVIEGISALEVAEMAGFTKGNRPRGLIQFITHRLKRYHLDRGVIPPMTPQGSSKVAVYIETIARRWLIEGGRKAIEMYVAEKRGQGRLRLVEQ
jgi:prophage antirepressor-like protein